MTMLEFNEILEGVALLEYMSNLYEYAGIKDNKYVFQSVNDDTYVELDPKYMLSNNMFSVQY